MKRIFIFFCFSVLFIGTVWADEEVEETFAEENAAEEVPVEEVPMGPPRKKVFVHYVEPTDIRQTVRLIGKVKANAKAKVVATESGVVEAVHIGNGERVKKGAKVLTIRNTELQLEYDLVKANEALEESEYKRSKYLHGEGIVSTLDFEKAEKEYNSAKAKSHGILKKLKDTVIVAPIGGITGSVDPGAGERISAGDEIVTIYDDAGLKVGFDVPDWMLPKIEVGDTVMVNGGAGEVYYVERMISPKTHMGKASATLEAKNIVIGRAVEVEVVTDEVKGALTVPIHSVFMQKDEPHVYVVSKKGKLKPMKVVLGIMEGEMVQVAEGLEAGAAVVKYITSNLYYGMAVEIANPKGK